MSYTTQATIADDGYMRARVTVAAAQEGCATVAGIPPDLWAMQWRHVWATAPGWADAWESALAAGVPNPGADEAVITDSMILAQVQSMLPFRFIGEEE